MAVKLDVTRWWGRLGMRELLSKLGAEDGLIRFVGGTVRDELLGIPHADVDLATRLDPMAVMDRLKSTKMKVIPTGIDHGTVTVVSRGQVAEITTLRRDVSTDGRRATVAFTEDWKEDAARRDFTINALSADPVTGEVFDYFGGLHDLEERHIRFIGDPLERIAEDHLRILRFFRFHARFGSGKLDEAALDACTARANDLMALSRERIADELLKLLGLPDPAATVGIMLQRAILKPVLPEIEPERLRDLQALIAAERTTDILPDALRRLAALLPRDPELAEAIAARLKLSNKARKRLACAANANLDHSPQALAYRIGPDCAADRFLLAGRTADATAIASWKPPRLPVKGGALIARGMVEGPVVARTLRRIEDDWVQAGFPTGDQLEEIVSRALQSAS
ncbi:MAG TPA: CCA tRNA nucleotidyltransferase [Sphingomicrobium sp.]